MIRLCKVLVGALLLLSACAPQAQSNSEAFIDEVYDVTHQNSQNSSQQRKARDVAIVNWAEEKEFDTVATIEELLAKSQTKAQEQPQVTVEQQDKKLEEDSDYISIWNAYRAYILGLEDDLKDSLMEDLTVAQVRQYYEEHPEQFERQDEVKALITPWENNKAGAAFELDIDEHNIRALEEKYDQLIQEIVAIGEGQREIITAEEGKAYEVYVLSRVEKGLYDFDDVVQAASVQCANQVFNDELVKRS